MMLRAVKPGIKGTMPWFGSNEYKAVGRIVVCPHCRGTIFREREAMLNTRVATFLGMIAEQIRRRSDMSDLRADSVVWKATRKRCRTRHCRTPQVNLSAE